MPQNSTMPFNRPSAGKSKIPGTSETPKPAKSLLDLAETLKLNWQKEKEIVLFQPTNPSIKLSSESPETLRIKKAIEAEPKLFQLLKDVFGEEITIVAKGDPINPATPGGNNFEKTYAVNSLSKGLEKPYVLFNADSLNFHNQSDQALRETLVDVIMNEVLDQFMNQFANQSESYIAQPISAPIASILAKEYLGVPLSQIAQEYPDSIISSAKGYSNLGFSYSALSLPKELAAAHNKLAEILGSNLRFTANSTGIYPSAQFTPPTGAADIIFGMPDGDALNLSSGDDILINGGRQNPNDSQISNTDFIVGGKGHNSFTSSVITERDLFIKGGPGYDEALLIMQSGSEATVQGVENVSVIIPKTGLSGEEPAILNLTQGSSLSFRGEDSKLVVNWL